jgi:hypothetical protein
MMMEMFFKVLFLILLLGGDRGLVPAPLGAFPQATVGCDGRANMLFAPGSPPLLLQQQHQTSLLAALCMLWLTRLSVRKRLILLQKKRKLQFG